MATDDQGYAVDPAPSVRTVDHLDPGVLYPGGGHVTWAKSRRPEVPFYMRGVAELSADPPGAAAQRRRDTAEDKRRVREGQRLVPIDPDDPWSECEWVKD